MGGSPEKDHGIVGICLGRHPRLRLLLQHSGEANRINFGSRTTSCCPDVVWLIEA